MASTAEAARLTEAHRLAQARLGAETVQQITATWPLLDMTDLDATAEAWLRLAIPLVRSQHDASARLAVAYLRAFRSIEAPTAPALAPITATFNPAQTGASLTITGPATVKAATARGVPLSQAADIGLTTSARAAMRLALNAGRSTIVDTTRSDPAARGWARATSGNPCAFCAMLASRGPAYSEESVSFEAHDGCSCGAEPVYDLDADWPAGARQYRDLWNEATQGADDQLNAFRRALA